ncbi:MAG: hypothetical protein ACYSW7_05320 [Planctomycetota bacterium]|jgi:hypothetical protein
MNKLRLIAIILNALALFVMISVITDEYADGEEYIPFILLTILNLIVIFSLSIKETSWLGLYLKRKRLEEQKHIEALEKDKKKE